MNEEGNLILVQAVRNDYDDENKQLVSYIPVKLNGLNTYEYFYYNDKNEKQLLRITISFKK